ncbi:carbon-nitrogen family hydrolase [Alkalicoccobacillus porphyridii]|uniref:Carbon-nitrogen family hydrolase n=1 Tax=Alkalicoccobacillus porphyridii TaxID=2597270 RepID=A0A553ZT63_9BACI|nr:carbon-nitrogen family hydrolase [Alkalicoccobacillus porphyridii]TSB44658.1 carbon-nitrogen family hydrolase [Alkalicoccobacillus porphyridii]
MRYGICQIELVPGNPNANYEKIEQWTDMVMAQQDKPDILVLPEMWTTAYALSDLHHLAEKNLEKTLPFLKRLAKRHQVHFIGGSVANQKNDGIYNTALVVNKQGELVYEYDKVHLVPMLNEPAYLQEGQTLAKVFELDGIKMGIIICYDLRFPELTRALALEGAQVLHIVAEWPEARTSHWQALQAARAIENQCYVVSSNVIGTHDGVEFAGRSMVIDPLGKVLAKAPQQQEETLTINLQLTQVPQVRQDVPVFKSRRADLY